MPKTMSTTMPTAMFRDPRVWTAIVTFGAAACLLIPAVLPARAPAVTDESIAEIRYICTESGELFTRRLTAASLTHPTTGKPTLVPAVYDPRKKKWKPGPPLEVMHRRGLLRPTP